MKRTLAIILAAVMLLTVPVLASSEPSDWAKAEIPEEYPQMFASVDVDVDYQRPITRAEFCMLAFKVYSDINGALPQTDIDTRFTDIGEETVDMFVPIANSLGIVYGVSDKEFVPRNTLTRQELCTMLGRIFIQLDPDAEKAFTEAAEAPINFEDASLVADWARTSVSYCISHGIIKGVSETQLDPLGTVSMEQAMVISARVIAGATAK